MGSAVKKEKDAEGVIIAKTHKRANDYLQDRNFWEKGKYRSFHELEQQLSEPPPRKIKRIVAQKLGRREILEENGNGETSSQ